jgi:hypothetical protein
MPAVIVAQCFAVTSAAASRHSEPQPVDAVQARSSRPADSFEYVFEIVEYLLRYERHPDGRGRFTLEDAKDFAWAKRGRMVKLRTVTKYWEENRLVAPYIYAFLQNRSFRATDKTRPTHVINWLTLFFSKERRVSRLFGRAAYAADVLSKIFDQREGDFVDLKRDCPQIKPFSATELELIPVPTRLEPLE